MSNANINSAKTESQADAELRFYEFAEGICQKLRQIGKETLGFTPDEDSVCNAAWTMMCAKDASKASSTPDLP